MSRPRLKYYKSRHLLSSWGFSLDCHTRLFYFGVFLGHRYYSVWLQRQLP